MKSLETSFNPCYAYYVRYIAKRVDVETFLHRLPVMDDMLERHTMWRHNLSAYCEQWQDVLMHKWRLAAIWQGEIPSGVLAMNDEVLPFLKSFADELNNRYQPETTELDKLLVLIEKLDGKPYKPVVWSL